MSSIAINQLLQNNSIWQASQKGVHRPALSTSYSALDKQLHYAGWPKGAITELLLPRNGIGEIRLVCPLLARLSLQTGYICWINPPFRPYAPALSHQQIDLTKLVIIRTQSTQDTIWSAQQAMGSKACSAALIWLPKKTLTNEMRKLTLAAKNGNCWGFVLRDHTLQQQSSAAALRIVMQNRQAQQNLSIIKQPGGWSGQTVNLNLFPERAYWNATPVNQWPVYSASNQSESKQQGPLKSKSDKHITKRKPLVFTKPLAETASTPFLH